jgi:maltooligosyltrehalose trehalohydrolase
MSTALGRAGHGDAAAEDVATIEPPGHEATGASAVAPRDGAPLPGERDRVLVWAPGAAEVAIVIGDERRVARAQANGEWELEAPPIGADYRVSLDGGDARPDPRSRWQPDGVHGASRWIAHDFAWRDQTFRAPPLATGMVYELHVGTFTSEGTYAAAARRLPALSELGVTHVELMPLATFPGRWGWGYDGVDLFAPHPAYGTPDELRAFVQSCHELGLAVVLDVVYNHFGPDGNYLGEFAPYFTDRYRTPWGMAVNLDGPRSDHVRAFFIDNACMWLRDYHFDGLRLDAVHALYDQSACHFLEELVGRVRGLEVELGKSLVVIAESDLNDPRLLRSQEVGGYGLDAQWSDDFHHALHAALTGERGGYYADFGNVSDIARALREGFVYAERFSPFRGRKHGRSLGELPGFALLGYLQNHDQIGNRACGERIAALMTPGRLRIGVALVFISPFVPMLFQGEEWGASGPFPYFTDHQDSDLAEAVRRGRTHEFEAFGWRPEAVPDPQAESTFRSAVLDWSEVQREPHRAIRAWYQALSQLRANTPELRDGRRDRIDVQWDDAGCWIRVQRGAVTFAANWGAAPVALPVPPGEVVLCHPERPAERAGEVTLAPDACCIWKV